MNRREVLFNKVSVKFKSTVQGIANRMGYSILRVSRERGEYMPNPPFNWHVFAPWFQPEFQDKIYKESAPLTLVSEDRAYLLYMFARYAATLGGDFAECGVYKGGTALLLSKVMEKAQDNGGQGKSLFLFDTFQGIPNEITTARDGYDLGWFSDTSYQAVQGLFRGKGFVKIHPGCIPETLNPVADRRFAFVHIDVDVYSSTKACMEFFYPRLVKGGILIDDDYGLPRYKFAARKAMDEFFADKAEKPISLRTGQSLIIKM